MNLRKCFTSAWTIVAAAVIVGGSVFVASPASAAPDTFLGIENLAAFQCLGNNSSNQSNLSAPSECAGVPSQVWTIRAQDTLTYHGQNEVYFQWENGNKLCLGLQGSTGPQLVVGTCSASSDHSQFWYGAGPDENDSLVNGHTGDCVGTKGSAEKIGTLVVEGACNASSKTQEWEAPDVEG